METLEVVAAYTLTADGRHDVAPDRIYTRELFQRHGAAVCETAKCASSCSPTGRRGSRVV